MCKRSEIARRANRALRWNHRVNFVVQHVAERLDNRGTDAAEAFGKRVCAKKYHAARFRAAKRFADATCVRANEVYLELADLLGGNAHTGEFAEAGIDPVRGFAGRDEFVHDSTGSVHALDCGRRERHFFVMCDNGMHLLEGKIVSGEFDWH
jgi:hypothetical protein